MSMNKAVSSLDAKAASIAPETEGCWMGSENRNISVKSPFEVGLIVIAFRGLNRQTPKYSTFKQFVSWGFLIRLKEKFINISIQE